MEQSTCNSEVSGKQHGAKCRALSGYIKVNISVHFHGQEASRQLTEAEENTIPQRLPHIMQDQAGENRLEMP